eukprot:CAMPEP_0176287318 /NCGR_PEP_ID=MMETSP0121_2-20121125/53372_1 /TAXON_ID=160619 /ORGANISM="Kryptoperidinium foliaceum, Strain CCMP 1326" /LENGTH=57 /DNA_ID=CAMNT_0017627927 /DNA_START=133 /DNA_END=306 /DNA_ORIENTATION=-
MLIADPRGVAAKGPRGRARKERLAPLKTQGPPAHGFRKLIDPTRGDEGQRARAADVG